MKKSHLLFIITTLLFFIVLNGCSTESKKSSNTTLGKHVNSTAQTDSNIISGKRANSTIQIDSNTTLGEYANSILQTIPNTKPTEQVNSTTQKTSKLTLDVIKKNYGEKEIKSIRNINSDYILVESQKESFANRFDLYNLKTGVMDTLPTMPEFVTLEDIVSENYSIFLSSGKNSESVFSTFPYIIKCYRVKYDDPEKGDNFIAVHEDKYFNLDESVQAGSKEGSLMSDLNITFDGLEVLFKPAKGKEGEFYVDATDIPPTKTIYDKIKRQLTIEIGTTQLGKNLIQLKKVNTDSNLYISSCKITQKNSKTQLILNLRDTAKKYIIKSKVLSVPNYFSHFSIEFAGEE